MTAPPPPQPPPQGQQPPPPPQDDGLGDTALAVAVAALLAGAAVTAAYATSVTGMLAVLKLRFTLSAAVWDALSAVLSMVLGYQHPVTGVIGPASEQVARMNAARRAQYVTAAARRVKAAEDGARAKGESVEAARKTALERERRYFEMHQKAMWDRSTAAGNIDLEAAVHGNLLGWLARRDPHVTPECERASGRNFYVDNPPYIGLPGIGPHTGCRCQATAPWPGGRLLPGSGPRYARVS